MAFQASIDAHQNTAPILSAILSTGSGVAALEKIGLISIADQQKRILYVNDEFVRLTGFSRDELVGQDYGILSCNHHSPEFFEELFDDLSKGNVWRGPLKSGTKNGGFLWTDAVIVPIMASDSRVSCYLSVQIEITNAVTAHIDINEKNQLLQSVLDNFPGGIAVYDRALRMVVCNEQQKKLLDLPDSLFENPALTLEDIYRFNAERGEYGEGDIEALVGERMERARQMVPHTVERIRPNGTHLEIKGAPLSDGGFVSMYIDITQRKRDQSMIEALAQTDTLTGLANRRSLLERIELALARVARGDTIALLYLDLDRFKAVNDTLGHPAGDALLKAVAKRLKQRTRATDTVARLGGDEFAILQVGIKSGDDAESLARRLLDEIAAPYDLNGNTASIGVSIGIAVAPGDGNSAEELLKNADLALYQSKSEGRGRYQFFATEMDARVRTRCEIEAHLRQALKRKELELHYQPIISCSTGRIISCEALLRWKHSKKGYIPTSDFIGVAEECGLIAPIGDWVLMQACQDARAWPEDVTVSVNVSVAQFRNRDLYASVMDALSGLDPKRLVLEVTETSLIHCKEVTLEMMNRLRSHGIRFALDDFGTGYSSLSYLQKYPFEKIKIDRSFVTTSDTNQKTRTLLSAIANLGRSLGMTTVAEGIETEFQFANVKEMGCDEAQGYLFCKPLPIHQLQSRLTTMMC